jgi:hypothetical protein
MNKALPILATILAVAAIAATVVVVPMAYAQTSTTSFSFSQEASNNCSGLGNCSNVQSQTFSVSGGG